MAGAALLLGSYPVFIERYLVMVTHTRIVLPRLPLAFQGLKIVQLTDLHYGPLVNRDFIRCVIERANAIEHDLSVCTGDYVHHARHKVERVQTAWNELAKLRAPLGVYSVLGNHDHWAGTVTSLALLEESGQSVHGRAVPLIRDGERIWLIGAGDFMEDHIPLDPIIETLPLDEVKIVLAHNPDSADTLRQPNVDLFLSGHTHGGQINLPLPGFPVIPVINKEYTSGLKKSPLGIPVFISRGIGWALAPVRLNCYPEIAVIELVRS